MFQPGAMGFGGVNAQIAVPSVDEFVDLDNFLDNYLTQLHTDHRQSQMMQQQQPHAGMQQQQQQQHQQQQQMYMQQQQQQQQQQQAISAQQMPNGVAVMPQNNNPTGSARIVSTGAILGPAGLMNPSQGGMQQPHAPVQQQPPAGFNPGHPAFLQGHNSTSLFAQMHANQGFGMLGSGLPGLAGGMANIPSGYQAAGGGGLPGAPGPMSGVLPGIAGLQIPPQLQQTMNSMGIPAGMGGPDMSGVHTQAESRPAPAGSTQVTGKSRGRQAKGGSAKNTGTSKKAGGASAVAQVEKEYQPMSSSDQEGSTDGYSSDGEGKARKKQLTADEAERRHIALQEKNRRAQRRFRERQKAKLGDLHKQIEELTHKLSNLQHENAALHSRTSILEKVLDMRNEQIQVMQETKESPAFPTGEEALVNLHDVGGQLVQLTPEMIKELSSDQIYKIYQLYVKELSNQLAAATVAPTSSDNATPPTALPGPGGPTSSGGSDSAAGAVATSSPSNSNAGAIVAAGNAQSEDPLDTTYAPILDQLIKDLSMMIMKLGVIKPLETRKFIVVSRQYLGSNEAEVIQLWKNVMKLIDLTEAQKRQVVQLKRMFLGKIQPIMEERKLLNVQIQNNLPHDTFHSKNALTYIKDPNSAPVSLSNGPPGPPFQTTTKTALAYIQAHEAVIKLRDNLRSEQHVVLEFAIAVFRGVFKPRQMASLLVKCYPAVPDALGIASALAAELGEPDSVEEMSVTMQMGGYGEHGSSALGTNVMTLHPSLVKGDAAGKNIPTAAAPAATPSAFPPQLATAASPFSNISATAVNGQQQQQQQQSQQQGFPAPGAARVSMAGPAGGLGAAHYQAQSGSQSQQPALMGMTVQQPTGAPGMGQGGGAFALPGGLPGRPSLTITTSGLGNSMGPPTNTTTTTSNNSMSPNQNLNHSNSQSLSPQMNMNNGSGMRGPMQLGMSSGNGPMPNWPNIPTTLQGLSGAL